MQITLIYIHVQYGSPEEAEHFRPLLPGCEVIGFDYKAQTPWEAEREFAEYFDGLAERGFGSIGIIANSIGAFYAMCALAGRDIAAAYFISPIVDLERIEGVTLDGEHLRYARQHPIDWRVPTHILYGENDNLTSLATISDFARRTGASLEVMPSGEASTGSTPRSRWRSWTGGFKELPTSFENMRIFASRIANSHSYGR